MKVRTGFVSNSSSSSFCLLGIQLDGDQAETFNNHDWGLDSAYGIYDLDGMFIGVSPENIDEDKTIKQIKKELVEKINSLFPESICTIEDVSWYTDGGMDN